MSAYVLDSTSAYAFCVSLRKAWCDRVIAGEREAAGRA